MRTNDEVTKDYIEFLEAQVFVLELDNQELKEENESLKVQLSQYQADREMVL